MLYLGRIARWFRDRGRLLFWYYDGAAWRRADPLLVGTALPAVEPDYLDLVALLARDPEKAMPGPLRNDLLQQQSTAALRLAAAARAVFKLAPLGDSAGVTDGEALRTLIEWFAYMEECAAGAVLFPSSPVGA